MTLRGELIDQVRLLLAQAGFAVSERCEIRPISFDVVARRDQRLLILKILGNVDALTERVAQELRTLAKFLGGTPLLIGERSGAGPLEDGVAYNHRGIAILTLPTLRDHLLENAAPLAFAAPGGLHVRLRGDRLRALREQRALSLGILAEVAGVSRRAIQMYEEGMRATIDAALRLEEYLQESLVDPIDPFTLHQELADPAEYETEITHSLVSRMEREIFQLLRGVGFRVVPTGQSPFNAVSQEKQETILTGVDRVDPQMLKRAEVMRSVSIITEKEGMIVVSRTREATNLGGVPLVRKEELRRVQDPRELVDLLNERKVRKAADS